MILTLIAAASLQAQAKELFANHSANPSAAQFRNVRKAGDLVCGEINKPNSQGGYNGFQRFAYRSDRDWVIELGVHYRMAEDGKQLGTEFMFDAAHREERRDLGEATKLLREALAAEERAEQLLKSCD